MKVAEHVKGMSTFSYFRAGVLYYETDTRLTFPIPADDTDGATFPREVKSIHLMRWIRAHVATLNRQEETV